MTFNPDDPKYTAYVIGELDDAQRRAIDAEIEANPEAAALVASTRAAIERISTALKAEPLPAFSMAQREAVLKVKSAGRKAEKKPGRPIAWLVALAASLLLAAAAGWTLRAVISPTSQREVATSEKLSGTVDWALAVTDPNQSKQTESGARSSALNWAYAASPPTAWGDNLGGKIQLDSKPVAIGGDNQQANAWAKTSGNAVYFSTTPIYETKSKDICYTICKPVYETNTLADYSAAKSVNEVGSMKINGGTLSLSSAGTPAAGYNFNSSPAPNSTSYNSIDAYAISGTNTYTGATTLQSGTLSSMAHGVLPPAQMLQHPGEGVAGPGPGVMLAGMHPSENSFQPQYKLEQYGMGLLNYEDKRRQRVYVPSLGGVNPSEVRGLDPTGATTKLDVEAVIADDVVVGARGKGFNLSDGRDGDVKLQIGGQAESEFNTEAYDHLVDNPFLTAIENPLSTFSIDVDTASYSNVRRFLMEQNTLPPPGAVRIEEFINYFRYDYPQPEGDKPFSVTTEVASCPWAAEHRLVRIGLKGREVAADKRPPSNLVFLIDVSGSMEQPNKLPLVQESLKLLTRQLGENDHVAIAVYAGNSGLVLPSTRGDEQQKIIEAIERLRAGGSTNGAQGIELAYEIASQNFLKGGVNRVILATDGDFNVGITNQDELVRLIEEKAKTGVFLTTLGFGYGNLKDSTMQKLADKGNGNNAYIDSLHEAKKVLVEQMGSTLVTIAKDVKIQVEFNPLEVAGYRLVGYEKRMLAKEDFNDDKEDAGEIGAGHTVTALYEIVPAHPVAAGDPPVETTATDTSKSVNAAADAKKETTPEVDPLRYLKPAEITPAAKSGELFTLKLRYKQPDGEKSTLMETPVKDSGRKYGQASADFQFASAVAAFGMILRDSQYKGNATLAAVEELAKTGQVDNDKRSDAGYRAEFVQMVGKAKAISGK